MGWYELVSLLSDGRVKFLLAFLFVTVVVAGVLTLVEIRLRKKEAKVAASEVDKSVVNKLRLFLKQNRTPREKLDFIDRVAKEYFRKIYKTSLNSSYSVLIKEFEKHQFENEKEIAFCRKMFAVHYSDKELTNDKVVLLSNLLVDILRSKGDREESSAGLSFIERIEKFFSPLIASVGNIRGKHIKKIEGREYGEKYKNEIVEWTRKAVEKGYSRGSVLKLLTDGKRTNEVLKKILSIYDKEKKMSREKVRRDENKSRDIGHESSGVAERIIEREKHRLVGIEHLS